jgi:hypothetical protein
MGSDQRPPEALRSPPLVGRRLELARLRRGVEAALLGRGNRIWLVGTAGAGKTRLIDEIVCYAQLRSVPFFRADAISLAAAADAPLAGVAPLVVVDPVPARSAGRVETVLRSFARSGGFAVATSRGAGSVPPDACIALPPLGVADVRRLLGVLTGRDPGAAEAALALRETGGIPREVERWVEAFARERELRATP